MHYEKRRLFIGVHLSPFLRKKLSREIAGWGKETLIPTNEENFQIMLHSLGFVLEDQIPYLCERLQEAADQIQSFDITFDGMEVLESLENPKQIQLSGGPSERLRLLHEAIEKSLGIFVTERKHFRPHVTLAKIKKAKWLAKQAAGQALPAVKVGLRLNDPVESITLFETTVREGKRLHDPLASFPLGQE